MCARGLACYPVSPNSACYLPVRCGFGSPSPVPTSPAAPVRRTTSLGGVWYLPSWECAGGEEGLVVTLRSEVSHNPCSTENLRSPSPQQTSCPKSLTDCSSIPPASLDVFSLAPGAFPIPLVQNILIRAPCPGQAHLEKVWEVPPGVDQRKPAPSYHPHSRGLRPPKRHFCLLPWGVKGRGGGRVQGSEDPRPRARSRTRIRRGKEMGWSSVCQRVRIWGGDRVSGRG